MNRSQTRMQEMTAKLKAHHLRLTPQRLAILRILAESDGHPSIEEIYAQMQGDFPTMSIATVYKTIHVLKELNEVLELGFPEGVNRYDGGKPYSHPHVICLKCKKIIDPDLGSIQHFIDAAARETGFRILNHRLDFFGICAACQQADP